MSQLLLWIISTFLIILFSTAGYWIGAVEAVKSIADYFRLSEGADLGLEAYSIGIVGLLVGLLGALLGLLVALILIHRLGRRWRVSVAKPTLLAFLTFLALLFLSLFILG